MNPVIKPVDGHVIYELTDEDRKLINRISLSDGGADIFEVVGHRMCVMQMVSLLTTDARRDLKAEVERYRTEIQAREKLPWEQLRKHSPGLLKPRPISDYPPCVSEVLSDAMIHINDNIGSTKMRNQLKKVVEDILNTCPLKVVDKGDGTVDETRDTTEAYRAAEQDRARILEPIYDYEETGRVISFAKCLELIREAAAVYKVTEETAI